MEVGFFYVKETKATSRKIYICKQYLNEEKSLRELANDIWCQ